MADIRLIVYTCVTGSYDMVRNPECAVPDWVRFICFTPEPISSAIWEWRPIPSVEKTPALTSRWPKINPHLALGEEDVYSLWMDANVVITDASFFDRVRSLMDAGVKYAGIHHPRRDDVYDEACIVLQNGRESFMNLVRTTAFLRRRGFPRHYGMMENNVILRRHNDRQVVEFDSLWWVTMKTLSWRDQLSQSYCLWQTGLVSDFIFPSGESSRNSVCLRYIIHDRKRCMDRSLRGRWNVYTCNIRQFCFRLWLRLLFMRTHV